MKRTSALAITLALATSLIATLANAAPPLAEIQAPRGQQVQAPRDRDDEVQAPRDRNDDVQAPRSQDVQAPRSCCGRPGERGSRPRSPGAPVRDARRSARRPPACLIGTAARVEQT